jgi:transposase
MKRREIFRSELGHSPTARLAELLARYRVKLTEERDRVHNRIHKVLEDACIQAIIRGQEHPDWLADYAKGKLRGNRPELRLAWRGRVKDRHRSMLRELMDDLGFDESKIQRLDTEIASRVDLAALSRLTTIPGIDLITAWTLLAELGTDMSVFASPRHAAAWAGLCPGNHESGGKRLSNRTRKETAGCVAHSVRRHGRQPARRRYGVSGTRGTTSTFFTLSAPQPPRPEVAEARTS